MKRILKIVRSNNKHAGTNEGRKIKKPEWLLQASFVRIRQRVAKKTYKYKDMTQWYLSVFYGIVTLGFKY